MPRGPKGQKRPADVIGNAVHVAKIATGEIEETTAKSGRVKSEMAGGQARAKALSELERRSIAEKAAAARWREPGGCSNG